MQQKNEQNQNSKAYLLGHHYPTQQATSNHQTATVSPLSPNMRILNTQKEAGQPLAAGGGSKMIVGQQSSSTLQ
jgi:hypothetical protein